MNKPPPLGYRAILLFWSPLAVTWLMMASEGPFLAAIIARLPDPKPNLAAHGVAFAIAIMVEAPVIMIMSASTALAKDKLSFLKLRNFSFTLNIGITLVMALLVFTPAMDFISMRLIRLPAHVAALVHTALFIMLPWPAAIGYRRFYQGLLIRGGQTRRVTYGTGIRMAGMSLVGSGLYFFSDLPGACVSAAALTSGVCLEAVAARIMANHAIRNLADSPEAGSLESPAPSYRAISRFYYPLALTSTLSLAVHPMVTFFVGQGRFPLESLAVIPVVNGLVFVFRAIGLSYQEAMIALIGERNERYMELRNFGILLGLLVVTCLGLIAFTPLSTLWFESISGLSAELAAFAVAPACILSLIPGLSVLLSMQRAILVKNSRTYPVTWATIIEVGGILAIIFVGIHLFDMVGATAAALALLLGRIAGNAYLLKPCASVLSRR
ncbi:MAG: hypothetical protein ABIK28_18970 [Planctomycetota bacterium]